MTTQIVEGYIDRFLSEVGVPRADVYVPSGNYYSLKKGSANIDVFFNSYQTYQGTTRTFIRFSCPLTKLPQDINFQNRLLRECLVKSGSSLGLKFAIYQDTLFSSWERDIEGLSYEEFVSTLTDTALWADQIDDNMLSVIAEGPSGTRPFFV